LTQVQRRFLGDGLFLSLKLVEQAPLAQVEGTLGPVL
jgi:hypothetical protein